MNRQQTQTSDDQQVHMTVRPAAMTVQVEALEANKYGQMAISYNGGGQSVKQIQFNIHTKLVNRKSVEQYDIVITWEM